MVMDKRILLALLVLFASVTLAEATSKINIPEPLFPWKEWVLHGHEDDLLCTPPMHDSGQPRCDWPTELVLSLEEQGGSFTQSWMIQHDRWIALPKLETIQNHKMVFLLYEQ